MSYFVSFNLTGLSACSWNFFKKDLRVESSTQGWLDHFSAFRDKQQSKPTLRDLQSKSGSGVAPNPIPAFSAEPPASPLNSQPSLGATLLDMSPTHTESPPAEVTLTDVFVPLESIKPSKLTWRLYASAHLEVQIYDPLSSLSPSFCPLSLQVVCCLWLCLMDTVCGFSFTSLATRLRLVLMCWWWSSPCCRPLLSPSPTSTSRPRLQRSAVNHSIKVVHLVKTLQYCVWSAAVSDAVSVIVFLSLSTAVYGSEAAASIRNWAPSFQPHSSSCCSHTDPAAGKPKQGKQRFLTVSLHQGLPRV